jgi:hypothetical protein
VKRLAFILCLTLCACRVKPQPKAVAVAEPAWRGLAWRWAPDTFNTWTNTVFVVLCRTNLLAPWATFAVTATNHLVFAADQPMQFFTVYASNTVTRLTSL